MRDGNNEDSIQILAEPQRWVESIFMKTTTSSSPRRGSQVIVIHPGSRFLRIGRASDVIPLSMPCVVARKCRTQMPEVKRIRNVTRPWSQMTQDEIAQQKEKTEEANNNKDPVRLFFSLYQIVDS